jgi:hypothetical protein
MILVEVVLAFAFFVAKAVLATVIGIATIIALIVGLVAWAIWRDSKHIVIRSVSPRGPNLDNYSRGLNRFESRC